MIAADVTRACGAFVLAMVVLFGALSTDVSAGDGRRVALVIGNGAYDHMNPLVKPASDATLIADKLRSVGFEVDLAIDDGQLNLNQRVSAFGHRARGASAAVFYFAGHGIQAEGRNYLLPVDAKPHKIADLSVQALPLSSVSFALDVADAEISMIILDACRNNPLTRSLSFGNGTRSTAITRGLAPVARASGRLYAYATAPGEVAYEGGSGTENSPFTEAVADWIGEPGLEVEPMFERVREQVITRTNGKQVPWIEDAINGDFYFQPVSLDSEPAVATLTPEPAVPMPQIEAAPEIEAAPTVAAVPEIPAVPETAPAPFIEAEPLYVEPQYPSPSPATDPIETAWSETTALGTRDAYTAFLKQYPNSAFAGEAVSMLLNLATPATSAAPPMPEPAASVPEVAVAPEIESVPEVALVPEFEAEPVYAEPEPTVPSPAVDPIETAWSETTALGTREAYASFLERYPDSPFARDAVSMLLDLASPGTSAARALESLN